MNLNKKNTSNINTVPQSNLQLHQKPRSEASLSDEWETPNSLYESLCYKYKVFPSLDLCADETNSKCHYYKTKKDSALNALADSFIHDLKPDIWVNPPHSITEDIVRICLKIWSLWNVNIMMIIPANSICTKYAEECIEPHAEYHPIFYRPKFLRDGEEKDPARNSYFVVIWRKK